MKKFWILAAICTLLAGCRESLEDRCAREAKEYTEKNCPTRMDKNIILDSMAFERDTHTLHYYYTLTGFADRDGVMEEVDAKGALKEDLKNSTSLRVYKENNSPTPTDRRRIPRRSGCKWFSRIKTINQ